jgi:hypothetical protein
MPCRETMHDTYDGFEADSRSVMSGYASHIDGEAVAAIPRDEMAPISAMCARPLMGFSPRHALGVWMDEKRVSISGPSERRTGGSALPVIYAMRDSDHKYTSMASGCTLINR